jgi:hypothetical protein
MKFKKLAEKLSEMSTLDSVVYLMTEKNRSVKMLMREKGESEWVVFTAELSFPDHIETINSEIHELISIEKFKEELAFLNDTNKYEVYVVVYKKPKSFNFHIF